MKERRRWRDIRQCIGKGNGDRVRHGSEKREVKEGEERRRGRKNHSK